MNMIQKIDHKKELKHLYNPGRKDFSVVDVPAMNFLMIDGQGNPNTSPKSSRKPWKPSSPFPMP